MAAWIRHASRAGVARNTELGTGYNTPVSFRFRNFPVYKAALQLHHDIVRMTAGFPREYDYLRDQLRRAALSIVLNIAEGSAKKSDRDFNRYLKNSLGSTGEVVAALDASYNERLISRETLQETLAKCEAIANQLGGFSKSLTKGS